MHRHDDNDHNRTADDLGITDDDGPDIDHDLGAIERAIDQFLGAVYATVVNDDGTLGEFVNDAAAIERAIDNLAAACAAHQSARSVRG